MGKIHFADGETGYNAAFLGQVDGPLREALVKYDSRWDMDPLPITIQNIQATIGQDATVFDNGPRGILYTTRSTQPSSYCGKSLQGITCNVQTILGDENVMVGFSSRYKPGQESQIILTVLIEEFKKRTGIVAVDSCSEDVKTLLK